MIKKLFWIFTVVVGVGSILAYVFFPPLLWSLVIFLPIILLGLHDITQKSHTILRNYPILGHFRYLLEEIRPEIYQYFVESNHDGRPFAREDRTVVYQRAKGVLDTLPFGTQRNVYENGYEWINHSWKPKEVDPKSLRVTIGGPDCKKPYSASILNISAMSYGSLSPQAVMALNQGAKMGHFAHNTGEGGASPYHFQGGDLIWQIGTGYFGCRTPDGNFCEKTFKETAQREEIKMIEIKISQGAKPGHGGILPAAKLTKEIAEIRHVPMGKDVLSPPAHKAFGTPLEFMDFIKKLRELTDGKPIGFKLCVGRRREFLAVCKAMLKTGVTPDFITVDGGEGGTGAAPLEFSNSMGCPLMEGLIFVHNTLVGCSLRDKIKIMTSSKVSTGYGIIKRIAVGADVCYSARAMMMALGCIQALKCNSNKCPTGVTTQDPALTNGLVVEDKNKRVANFHKETIESVAEMLGSMGLERTTDLKPWHIMRRVSPTEIKHYGELYSYLKPGDLGGEDIHPQYKRAWNVACPTTFEHRDLVAQ